MLLIYGGELKFNSDKINSAWFWKKKAEFLKNFKNFKPCPQNITIK